jgi:hypothetical protein
MTNEIQNAENEPAKAAKKKSGKPKVKFTDLIAIIISLSAVVLSQFRPVYTYFDKPKIDMNVGILSISHWGGILFLSSDITFNNEGTARGSVNKINLFVESAGDGKFKTIFKAFSYYMKPSSMGANDVPTSMAFNPFMVDENKSWDYYVNFGEKSDMKKQQMHDLIIGEAQQYLQTHKITDNDSMPNDLFNNIQKFSRENLKRVHSGTYYLLVQAWDDTLKNPTNLKLYTFELDSMRINFLDIITNSYKAWYGFSKLSKFVQTDITNIADKTKLDAVLEDYKKYESTGN